jgi:uncharacterized membrane protein (TIGR02234 family)
VKRHAAFGLALLLDLLGAAGALLVALRRWQTITTPRPAPLHDDLLRVSGRTIDAAPTALALVALAGVVAVLATRGMVRRVIGGVLALAGVGLIWRAVASAGSVSTSRARALVREHHATVTASGGRPHVATSEVWPALTVVCGVLVLGAGALIAWRGHDWQAMSARYERSSSPERDATKAAASLWSALDRGEDPTN